MGGCIYIYICRLDEAIASDLELAFCRSEPCCRRRCKVVAPAEHMVRVLMLAFANPSARWY